MDNHDLSDITKLGKEHLLYRLFLFFNGQLYIVEKKGDCQCTMVKETYPIKSKGGRFVWDIFGQPVDNPQPSLFSS